jgi:hypothetical protein
VTRFIEELRGVDLYKIPGVAETIDWTAALVALDQTALSLEVIRDTIGTVLKYQDDIAKLDGETTAQILSRVQATI